MNAPTKLPPVSSRRYETPLDAGTAQVRRFTVGEYHEMIRSGLLSEDEPFELLEGWIVRKMPNDPVHAATVSIIAQLLRQRLGPGYCVREQAPTTTDDSEPEPDIVVARGSLADYLDHHPGPGETALVIEVSNTSLARDREWKRRIYARAGVPEYWIVNLDARAIERYALPQSTGADSAYAEHRTYAATETIELPVSGAAALALADVFPRS